MVKSHVPFPHLSTIFEALRCHSLAERINQDKTLAPFKISGRAAVRYIKQPIGHQKYAQTIFLAPSSLQSFSFEFIGVFNSLHSSNLNNTTIAIRDNQYPKIYIQQDCIVTNKTPSHLISALKKDSSGLFFSYID
jgi:hypothetical protein